uniref:beta-aspartyl-peptidase n=1 Tax=Eutreptiella gymnastica TaxID=73025 RepID=A0A7S1JHZ9_9EUGL
MSHSPLNVLSPRQPLPLDADGRWALAVHGGAGNISDQSTIPARLREFDAAFQAGHAMLEEGATALDTVIEVVRRLEDCAYFNAGRGSVFTNAGKHEMDASVMDGTTGSAGAVCNVSNIRNPVHLAHAVATGTQHVLLCGAGAESLAPRHGITREDDHYFFTQERYDQLVNARRNKMIVLDHGGECFQDRKSIGIAPTELFPFMSADSPASPLADRKRPTDQDGKPEHKFGTVGCVARDKHGNLAAAGSTGGLTNKQPGRVGDTPLVGAGIYANSRSCAIACTGQGETFIKNVVAHDIHARMKYLDVPLAAAMDQVIFDVLPPQTGGAIGVDKEGNAYAAYNTNGMFTGLADSTGRQETWHKLHGLYGDIWQEAGLFPALMDPFVFTGILKVWYTQKLGAVGTLKVDVTHGVQLRARECQIEPSVHFAGAPLSTLIMVHLDDQAGETLHWCVTNIPDTVVPDGSVALPYRPPSKRHDQSPKSSFVFVLFTHTEPIDFAPPERAPFSTRALMAQYQLAPAMGTFFTCGVEGP